ncbi:hypothetical protein [Streptomyces sp. NPDC057616]|uniref:hypothetical protein n=1 Tax=Streptomyces sp. NPDC057616 TaxID=3346183 RepID=UPI0036CF8E91
MEILRRAFLAVDRHLGGAKPPPKVQVFWARHPVVTGAIAAVLNGLLCAWAVSAFDDPVLALQSALWGLGAGLLFWLLCRLERWRQGYYERNGWPPVHPPAPVEETPVWLAGVRWIGTWSVLTVVLWALGQLRDPPNGWIWSAIYAGLMVIANWAARRAAARGGRRRA